MEEVGWMVGWGSDRRVGKFGRNAHWVGLARAAKHASAGPRELAPERA